jgi:hypothetical protein
MPHAVKEPYGGFFLKSSGKIYLHLFIPHTSTYVNIRFVFLSQRRFRDGSKGRTALLYPKRTVNYPWRFELRSSVQLVLSSGMKKPLVSNSLPQGWKCKDCEQNCRLFGLLQKKVATLALGSHCIQIA